MTAEGAITASPVRDSQYLVSVLALANSALIALSFTAWFSGTMNAPGFADRLLGSIRFGGFRADFVWLFFSTIAFFFVGIVSAAKAAKGDRPARVAAILCGVEVLFYVLFLRHSLTSGLLYFG